MEPETEPSVKNLLREQYLTFDQTVELSKWNFKEQKGENFENESDLLAELLEKLLRATKAGDVNRLKSVENGGVLSAYNPYYQMFSDLSKGSFVLLTLALSYWVFSYFPEGILKKGISPTGAAFITVAPLIVGLMFYPFLLQLFDEIQRKRMRTIDDRYKYFHSQADLHGLFDEIFESKSVITFLNKTFQWCLPVDPFLVWNEPFMVKSGEAWIIGFEGDQFFLRIDKKTQDTYKRIAYLLLNPYKDVSCLDLMETSPGEESEIIAEREDFFADEESKDCHYPDEKYVSSYRIMKNKLQEIEEEIHCARERGDTLKLENLQSQRDDFSKYINKTFYRDGNERGPTGALERARKAIKQNRARFILKVAKINPILAEHLRITINMAGNSVSYRPPEKIEWTIQIN